MVRRIIYSIIAEVFFRKVEYSMQKFIRTKKEQEYIKEFLLSSKVV